MQDTPDYTVDGKGIFEYHRKAFLQLYSFKQLNINDNPWNFSTLMSPINELNNEIYNLIVHDRS